MTTHDGGGRVLVVDDSAAIHDDFRKILGADPSTDALDEADAQLFGKAAFEVRPAAFTIDFAFQSEEAVLRAGAALAEGRPYALAFVDVRIPPGLDGIETIRRLWEATPDLQVVICTAYSDYSWRDIIERLGMTDSLVILRKPFDNIEVLQLAHALTKKWTLARRLRERLEESEAHFRVAFQTSPVAIEISAAEGGRVVDVNQSFLRLFELERGDAIGRRSEDLGLWSAGERARVLARNARGETLRDVACTLRTRSGKSKSVLFSAERMQVEGVPSFLCLFHDVSERAQIEEQLRHMQRMEAVGGLAAGVAHQFGGVLAVILRSVQIELARSRVDAQAAETLREIWGAASDAQRLVDRLLSFSTRQELRLDWVDLVALVGGMTHMIRRLFDASIDLIVTTDPDLPALYADWNLIEQVLLNLVQNAADAMTAGGTLTIDARLVTIDTSHPRLASGRTTGRCVRLSVQDTGPGMDAVTRERLFDPLLAGSETTPGTKLGLAVSRGIVEQHGGWIEVESDVGRGSIFRIFLPTTAARAERAAPDVRLPSGASRDS